MGAIAGTARSYKGLAMRRSAPWARFKVAIAARPAPTGRDYRGDKFCLCEDPDRHYGSTPMNIRYLS